MPSAAWNRRSLIPSPSASPRRSSACGLRVADPGAAALEPPRQLGPLAVRARDAPARRADEEPELPRRGRVLPRPRLEVLGQRREHAPSSCSIAGARRASQRSRRSTARRAASARSISSRSVQPGAKAGSPAPHAPSHAHRGAPDQQAPAAHARDRIFAAMPGRSPLDREILGLAAPALGALAAEPLYLLVDTAIVGHLGTTQLAALALAATVLSSLTGCASSSPTGRRRRSRACTAPARCGAPGSSPRRRCGSRSRSASVVAARLRAARRAAHRAARRRRGDRRLAERYLRIAALGLPLALIALAGQGYLRGIGDLRTPLVIVAVAQARERGARGAVRLRVRLGPGRLGGRHGHRAARDGRGVRLAAPARGRAGRRPPPRARADPAALRISWELFLRTAALLAAFAHGERGPRARRGAVARRPPGRVRAVHLPRARARRVRDRRAGARRARARARATSATRRRPGGASSAGRSGSACSFGAVLLALHDVLPRAFTSDPAVLEQRRGAVAAVRAHAAGRGRRVRARRDPHRRGRHALPRRSRCSSPAR